MGFLTKSGKSVLLRICAKSAYSNISTPSQYLSYRIRQTITIREGGTAESPVLNHEWVA